MPVNYSQTPWMGGPASGNANAPVTDWGSLLGAGIPAISSLIGNSSATGDLTSAEQAAINTQTGTQQQLGGIYGPQRSLGNAADSSLGAQLGLGGTPNYAPFYQSPGFQFSLGLGNQGIERAASANGSLYTPNTLAQLGQYDTGFASQNYNNYISQLMQSAGLGAQGNAGLAQGITQTGGNISQLQQNQGNAQAGGAANNSGIVGNLLSKLPYGSIGAGISNMFGGGTNASSSGVTQTDDPGGFNGLFASMNGSNTGSSDPTTWDTPGGTTTYFGDDSSNPQ